MQIEYTISFATEAAAESFAREAERLGATCSRAARVVHLIPSTPRTPSPAEIATLAAAYGGLIDLGGR